MVVLVVAAGGRWQHQVRQRLFCHHDVVRGVHTQHHRHKQRLLGSASITRRNRWHILYLEHGWQLLGRLLLRVQLLWLLLLLLLLLAVRRSQMHLTGMGPRCTPQACIHAVQAAACLLDTSRRATMLLLCCMAAAYELRLPALCTCC
jgi:hypothetical protein